jgi:predicted ABC-type ATPase
VNADMIAAGLSTLKPEVALVTAGRAFLRELDRLAAARIDFAFETTLSGRSHVTRLAKWKRRRWRIEIVYLKIASPDIALKRIAARVRQGGHDVPREDVLRRFGRSWENFTEVYRRLAHAWSVYDNSGSEPRLLEQGP